MKKLKVKINKIKESEAQKIGTEAQKIQEVEVPAGSKKFLKVAKLSVYALVFLLPLFFLPFTSNVLDFNKQALLLFLVFVSLISWLISCLISNRLEINITFLNLPVLLLLLIVGISTIFSLSRYASFWGWPLTVSSSFISLLGFVTLYFLIANLFKKKDIPFLFLTLFLSGFIVALYFIFQLFGKFIFPFDFAKISSFNTIGTINSLAIYFSILLILLLPLFFFVSRFFRIILGVIGTVLLVSLFLINFKIAWLIFLAGLTALFVLGVVNLRRTSRSGFINLTMTLLVIVSLLIFFRFPLPGPAQLPLEVSASQKVSIDVLRGLSLKSLILGTGPGTFIYDWSRYKPQEINQTVFWSIRLGQAGSEILDRLITSGILGILAFFFLVFIFFKLISGFLLKKKEDSGVRDEEISSWFLVWGIFASFIGLLVAFFLYPANVSIYFLFWLLIGCLALLEKRERKTFDFGASAIGALTFSFLFILILVLGISFFILYGQKYAAEVRYSQGLKAWQRGDIERGINYMTRAVNLNPKMAFYWRDLSQIYLARLNQVLSKTTLSQEERNNQTQTLIASFINSANQATVVEPNNLANWNNRGFVYRNMLGILPGADDWAIKSFQKALDLEPNNPDIFVEIGRVYLAKSDTLAQQEKKEEAAENLKLAQENFEKAINLKSNYTPVHYQLGVLYYNSNQFDKARAQFEKAVLLEPSYSNARYFLGLIYDREGNKNEAISQFEKIEQLNPENQEVKKILENLKGGRRALEEIISSTTSEP